VVFEITYEILYDMRDLEGDRRVGVPTYPVVHGLHRSRQLIDVLLAVSVTVIVATVLAGVLGLREVLFVAAPLVQLVFYRPRYRRGLTSADCIWLTHAGTAMLLLFAAGTQVWLRLGLPENIHLR
jgi:4-hydroxybenzoate polyprenyltransferase